MIRVIDLETTGFAPPAAPCEVAYCDVVSKTTDLAGDACDWHVPDQGWALLCNPGHPIPPETSAIHHIVDADVADRVPWPRALERALYYTSRDGNGQIVALASHNAKFERQWITDEIAPGTPWICTYKCALRLWPEAPAHSNGALRYWRRLEVDRDLADRSHRAGPDAYVTAHLLADMLAFVSIDKLIEWSAEPALLAKCHIGSWRGRKWSEIDEMSFFNWILARDFDEDVMHTARHYRDALLSERAS